MKKIYKNNGYNDVGYDIGYSIGEALGNIWGNNYNQRGIEKAQQAMDDQLQKVANNMDTNRNFAAENEALDKVLSNYGSNLNDGWEPMPNMPPATNQQSEQAMKQGWNADGQQFVPMQGVAPERNYQAYKPDFSFKGDEFKANFARQQRALGRPQHQIDAALAAMEPRINNLDQQAKTARTNAVIEQLAGMPATMNNADYLKLVNSLAQDSPEMAKVYLQDTIKNKDVWNANQAINLASVKANQQRQAYSDKQQGLLKSREGFADQYGLTGDERRQYILTGKLGGKSSSTSKEKSIYDDKGMSRYQELYAKVSNGEDLNDLEKAELNTLDSKFRPALFPTTDNTARTNWNDWNSIVSFTQAAKSRGYSDDDILETAAANLGGTNSEMYQALARSLQPKQTKPVPQQPQVQQQPTEPSVFSSEYWDNYRNGDTAVKRFGAGNYGDNGYTWFDFASGGRKDNGNNKKYLSRAEEEIRRRQGKA